MSLSRFHLSFGSLARAMGLLALVTVPAPVSAADGTVKVYDSTFNEFAAAIQPLQVTGHYNFGITIDLGLFGRHRITICSSDYAATVSALRFRINPNNAIVDGSITASWCGLTFTSSLLTTGNIFYNQADQTVRFSFGGTNIQPCFTISFMGIPFTMCVPVQINVGPTFNVPPLPVRTALISFESTGGARRMRMTPRNVTLVKRAGYIELQSDVSFW